MKVRYKERGSAYYNSFHHQEDAEREEPLESFLYKCIGRQDPGEREPGALEKMEEMVTCMAKVVAYLSAKAVERGEATLEDLGGYEMLNFPGQDHELVEGEGE